MAGENRGSPVNLKEKLLAEGETFSFFQAMRLLHLFIGRDEAITDEHDPLREFVRIRPNISLAHPGTELDGIEQLPQDAPKFLMTANFLGLYGEFSPLPAFYSEDLIHESPEKDSVTRDFFDILNYPIYLLFYKIWTKYRPFLKIVDEKDPKYLEILFSLMGLGVENIKDDVEESFKLLRYIGLFTQFPKSALGLKRLLSDALDQPRLQIIPCTKRKVKIPLDQRCFLGVSGNVLGKESYLGETIEDRTRKYRIKIGPVNEKHFRKLLPGTPDYKKIISLSKFYLLDPFESDLEIVIDKGQVQTARLGDGRWSQLGMDTWSFSGKYREPVNLVFELA